MTTVLFVSDSPFHDRVRVAGSGGVVPRPSVDGALDAYLVRDLHPNRPLPTVGVGNEERPYAHALPAAVTAAGKDREENPQPNNGDHVTLSRQQLLVVMRPNADADSQSNAVTSDDESHSEAVGLQPLNVVTTSVLADTVNDVMFTTTPPVHCPAVEQIQNDASYATVFNDDAAFVSPHLSYYQRQDSHSTGTFRSSLTTPPCTYIPQCDSFQQHKEMVKSKDESASAIPLYNAIKASPTTIQWLLENYETIDGVSLPRCAIYSHYLQHCAESNTRPMNAASFGKLIRSIYFGLRTRRLGTRGKSKYHYYGIRVKPGSPFEHSSPHAQDAFAVWKRKASTGSQRRRKMKNSASSSTDGSDSEYGQRPFSVSMSRSEGSAENEEREQTMAVSSILASSEQKPSASHDCFAPVAPPAVSGEQLESLGKPILSSNAVNAFFAEYRRSSQEILDCVNVHNFHAVNDVWRRFWQRAEGPGERAEMVLRSTYRLGRSELFRLCFLDAVQRYVQAADLQLYQTIVESLIDNVLKPVSNDLTQSIRAFAKQIHHDLQVALQGVPDVLLKIKLDAVSSLAHTLRRYTGLNHLAQAARAVVQNQTQTDQMLADLSQIDFRAIQEQASWVCPCDSSFVQRVEDEFKACMQPRQTLEQWAEWLESVVNRALAGHIREGTAAAVKAARQFLMTWSFYSSMIVRDLTLRSAPSFGSFHLMRLLCDEYMFFVVEQKLSALTGQPSVSLMSESSRTMLLGPVAEETKQPSV